MADQEDVLALAALENQVKVLDDKPDRDNNLNGAIPISSIDAPASESESEPTPCVVSPLPKVHDFLPQSQLPLNPLDPVPKNLRSVEGIDKLRRAIGKELVSENSNERCSNLPHLLSIVECIWPLANQNQRNGSSPIKSRDWDYEITPAAVLKPFNYVSQGLGRTIRFIVDIVSFDGDEWSKVSARNPKSLALLAAGSGGYGQKSMLDHAKDYLECANQNPVFFKPPRVSIILALLQQFELVLIFCLLK